MVLDKKFPLFFLSALFCCSCKAEVGSRIDKLTYQNGKFYYYFSGDFKNSKETVKVYFAIPVDTDQQTFSYQEMNPEPDEIRTSVVDGITNRLAVWTLKPSKAGLNEFWISYNFKIWSKPERVFHDLFEEAPDISFIDKLKATNIDELKEVASTIMKRTINKKERAYAAFVWMAKSFNYKYLGRRQTVSEVLASKFGDCNDFAKVFTKLLGYLNIRNRTISGQWLSDGGGHVWTQIQLDKLGWISVDPSLQSYFSSAKPEEVIASEKKHRTPVVELLPFFGNFFSRKIVLTSGASISFVGKTGERIEFKQLQPGGMRAIPPGIKYSKNVFVQVQGSVFLYEDEHPTMTEPIAKKIILSRWKNWESFFLKADKEIKTQNPSE